MLKSAVRSAVPEAEFVSVTTDVDIHAAIDRADLLLINRVLDGTFSNTSGLDLIDTVVTASPQARVMLVSNFADAQQQAIARGALPGIGKSTLRSPQTKERILSAIQTEKA